MIQENPRAFFRRCSLSLLLLPLFLLSGCGGENSLGNETISAGNYHTCYSKDDDIYCWGRNNHGQTNLPSDATGKVIAGGDDTCIRSVNSSDETKQDLSCHGSLGSKTITQLPQNFSRMSIGDLQACIYRLDTDTKIECWGSGLGTIIPTEYKTIPTSAIASGGNHVCAIQGDHPYCWGLNSRGQANGPVFSQLKINEIAAGANHTCGSFEYTSGAHEGLYTVYCWGDEAFGQLRGGAVEPYSNPSRRKLTNLKSSAFHTCGIYSETVVCWGRNDMGQSTVPAGLTGVTDIAVGRDHTCAISRDGVSCWGSNAYGQLNIPAALDADKKTEKHVKLRVHNLRLVDSNNQLIAETTSNRADVEAQVKIMNDIYAQCDRKWTFELVEHDTITFQNISNEEEGIQLGELRDGQVSLRSSDAEGRWAMLSLALPNEDPNQHWDPTLVSPDPFQGNVLTDTANENAKRLDEYHIFYGHHFAREEVTIAVAPVYGTWQFIEEGSLKGSVMAHEFGHSLGTSAAHEPHGRDPNNLMFEKDNGKTEITAEQCEFFWNSARTLTHYTSH